MDIIELLENSGSEVGYFDPYIPFLSFNDRNFKSLDVLDKKIQLISLMLARLLQIIQMLIIIILLKGDILIIDTRNVFQNTNNKNIKRLGQVK